MITVGIDIGSLSGKAVVMEDRKLISSAVIYTGPDSTATAEEVMKQALKKSGYKRETVDYVVSTGYGRVNVPFAKKHITEITCHARGNWSYFPDVSTILDMGGQDCKTIRCDSLGRVTNFAMNDKCAARMSFRCLPRLSNA